MILGTGCSRKESNQAMERKRRMHNTIFISSTFSDMHLERDAIHTSIMPALNAEAKKWGDSVSACDLRWGIDTSGMGDRESSEKVLNVCLGEINRCRPYMIALIGYRYGWIPDEELVSRAIAEAGDFTLDDKEISVTALEIEYGALANVADPAHTLFYFREIDGPFEGIYQSEDDLHRKKLEALKAKILSTPHAHVRTYRVNLQNPEQDMQAFSSMVLNDLKSLMMEEWRANRSLDAYAIDQKRQWAYLEEKNAQLIAREGLAERCRTILTEEHDDLLIHGEIGSGKSTLMSHLGISLHEGETDVVPLYCGLTDLTTSGFDILQYLIYEVERRLGSNHFSETTFNKPPTKEEWLTYMQQLFEAYETTAQRTLVFLIDGVNQLTQDEFARDYTFIPDARFSKIRHALSTATADRMPLMQQIRIGNLDENERLQVVTGILKGRRRELPHAVIQRIVQLSAARLPLYMSLIIQRLVMMDYNDYQRIAELGGGMDAITRHQLALIDECPTSLGGLSAYIMAHGCDQVGGEPVKLMGYFLAA